MKKLATLFYLLLILPVCVKAQTVTIPDSNFALWLQTNYSPCMNGNLMNTTCPNIQNTTYVELNNMMISDLSGIEYFVNLQVLDCQYNQLTVLPTLPSSLTDLYCQNNQLTVLPTLPTSLQNLWCHDNQLTVLPVFPASLQYLYCYNNQLTVLPSFPSSLQRLQCQNNNISCFPVFPNSLSDSEYFNISGNPFSCLPNYVNAMDATTLAYPLCVSEDLVNNPNGCLGVAAGILDATSFGSIHISPNPANEWLTILLTLPATKAVFLTLFNPLGQVIKQQELKDANGNVKTEIEVSKFPTGLYYLTVNGQGWVRNEKVMIIGQ